MGFFNNLFGKSPAWRIEALAHIQSRFAIFRALLDQQNQALKIISELEERARGGLPFDVQIIRRELNEVQEGVGAIIARMVELGGEKYAVLGERFEAIKTRMEQAASAGRDVEPDEFVVPFSRLGRERAFSVGVKNANLGEMKSALSLPVPDGFAISAWAYHHYISANRLHERLPLLLKGLKIEKDEELDIVSEEIREMIGRCPVPGDLADAIYRGYDALAPGLRNGKVALRSSAIGEDTAFTFAGQYVTFLGVGRDELLDRYREVLISKFTPAAIHYFLSHALLESHLAMSVGCMGLVDAASSGVIYTRDPLDPESPCAIVNSIFGLGSYLVEGRLTPDVFRVLRDGGAVVSSKIAEKPVRLSLIGGSRVAEEIVPEAERAAPSLSEELLKKLTGYAMRIESHYGGPQDIEWAVGRDGELNLLQTRPLRLMKKKASPPMTGVRPRVVLDGGTTICPGAGGGKIFHVESPDSLGGVPDGAILIARNPSPKLIRVIQRISALVTEVGGVASHMATLAREVGVPAVAGLKGAWDLPDGMEVTLDASEGTLFEGIHEDLIASRRPEKDAAAEGPAMEIFRELLALVAHLNLINPGDENFKPERCETLHDITRYIHQKAMEEMFTAAKNTAHKDRIGRRLKTDIPLLVNIIHLDSDPSDKKATGLVPEDQLNSAPMEALWSGVKEEGWPSRPVPPDLKGFLAVMGSNINRGNEPEFSENSYAFLSREYMLLNLRMGYHFATIEALVTREPGKNYIRMQYKEGGAPVDRRVRRIKLITELLTLMGFESSSRGDFLDAIISYQDEATLCRLLNLIGRINIITKQLDMALSNDAVARWYTDDFIKRLGLAKAADRAGE